MLRVRQLATLNGDSRSPDIMKTLPEIWEESRQAVAAEISDDPTLEEVEALLQEAAGPFTPVIDAANENNRSLLRPLRGSDESFERDLKLASYFGYVFVSRAIKAGHPLLNVIDYTQRIVQANAMRN